MGAAHTKRFFDTCYGAGLKRKRAASPPDAAERPDDDAGEGDRGDSDWDLVSTFLMRQVRLRVRMVPEDLDEEAEELEWRRRWEEWMAADAEATRAEDGFALPMCRTP